MSFTLQTDEILPHILSDTIRLLVVGSAPTPVSGELGHYYADKSEQFYRLLHDAGFTDERLTPELDWQLPDAHIGLTHLAVTTSVEHPTDLEPVDYSIGRLIRLVFEYSPKIVCFNGEHAFQQFFDRSCSFGEQKVRIGEATVYVVPSSNTRFDGRPYRKKLTWYENLHQVVGSNSPS